MSGTPEGLAVVEGNYEASDAHLKQQIGLVGLIALAVSVQVGSGWLLATLAAASIAGPASIVTCARRRFLRHHRGLVDGAGRDAAAVRRGRPLSATDARRLPQLVQRVGVSHGVVIPTVTAGLMFTAFSSSNFTIGGGFAPMGGGAVLGALATGGIVFAYSGLRQILDFGGEVVNPQRKIPIAIVVGGLFLPLVIYILQIGFIGAFDWTAAGVHPGHWAGLKGSHWESAPLLNAVTAAGFGWFATVLLTDAAPARVHRGERARGHALSPSATGWVFLGIATRTVHSMSVNSELPKASSGSTATGLRSWPSPRAPWSASCSSFRRQAGTRSSGWSRSRSP